jgi:GNAT superfamily N-acetyltransferase
MYGSRLGRLAVDEIAVFRCDGAAMWPMFARHHYLSDRYAGHGAIIGLLDDRPVAFASFIAYPSGTIPQPARREHRTVVLPDYQGMGIGVRVSEFLGTMMLRDGYRFFSKTSHPRMGEYRNISPLWKPTVKNEIARSSEGDHGRFTRWQVKHTKSYSHEFVGDDPDLMAWAMSRRRRSEDALW